MSILLQPPAGASDEESLTNLYDRAISEAIELFIVTAYLTDWKPKSAVRDDCEELSFIVGTDFGITTRKACRSVLKWLPKSMKNDFLAADTISGFHPKLVLWKSIDEDHNIVLGSSNLTQAAFTTNYEANMHSSNISPKRYDSIKGWISYIRLHCSPISNDWINSYKEKERPASPRRGRKTPVVSLNLPSGKAINAAIKKRRAQQKAFADIKPKLVSLIESCASGEIPNTKFYGDMMQLWGHHESRFQGSGFHIRGKRGNWKEICTAISIILTKSSALSVGDMDNLVKKEIDKLASARNPARHSWLSEMLCHFFPKRYPLLNTPIREWLRKNKYKSPSSASDGATYIDLSIKLRNALKSNTANIAKNLAELDHAIWLEMVGQKA